MFQMETILFYIPDAVLVCIEHKVAIIMYIVSYMYKIVKDLCQNRKKVYSTRGCLCIRHN